MLLFAADATPTLWERFVEWFSGTVVCELFVYLKARRTVILLHRNPLDLSSDQRLWYP